MNVTFRVDLTTNPNGACDVTIAGGVHSTTTLKFYTKPVFVDNVQEAVKQAVEDAGYKLATVYQGNSAAVRQLQRALVELTFSLGDADEIPEATAVEA